MFFLPIENLFEIFWCKYYVIFSVPFRMRSFLCVTHSDLLLICLWAQLPDRASFLIKRNCYHIRIIISFWALQPGFKGLLSKKRTLCGVLKMEKVASVNVQ